MSTTTAETFEFILPDLAEGMAEGEIVQWVVKEGDSLEADQPMVEVLTDKATVELTSPRRGKVAKILWKEGEVVPVGSPLLVIELAPGESKPAPSSHGASMAAAVAGVPAAAPKAEPAPAPQPEPAQVAVTPAAPVIEPVKRTGKALATPATRKLARDLGIDIQQVPGTGPAGRVLKDDVLAFANGRAGTAAPVAQPVAPAPAPLAATGAEERIPLKGLRKVIAERMAHSKRTVAHVTHVDEVDLTELVATRAKLKAKAEAQGVKLSYLPFFVKAVVAALKQMPQFNASLDEAAGELVLKKHYHIGIAVDTPTGLIVPVVKDADRKSILEIAREIGELAERARQGKNSMDELKGGTFSITNIGAVGGLFATPVVNHPEVAILAVNKLQKRPVVRDGEIVARDMMYLALSFDHRVVDGADAARFVNLIASYLADPLTLFMEMA